MGIISSNRIPGEGKSGNWRKAARSSTVRLASSVVLEEAAEERPREAPLSPVIVGSGEWAGGCEEVEDGWWAVGVSWRVC